MSINYFYQAWNFHDLHFFISYYEVYIHSEHFYFFFFFFWELLELCGKEVKQEKVNEGEHKGPHSYHLSFTSHCREGTLPSRTDSQPDTLHHSKMMPQLIQVRMRHFIYGKGGQTLWSVNVFLLPNVTVRGMGQFQATNLPKKPALFSISFIGPI